MIAEIIHRFAAMKYIREILDHPTDLAEFRNRPTPRLITGLILMALSYIIGWPAVAFMIFLSAWLQEPLIAIIGCPATYGFSYVVFIAGAWLARAPHYLGILTKYTVGLLFRKLLQCNL